MDRILLAFDASPAAWDALDTAAALARLTDAAVGIVHVRRVDVPDRDTATLEEGMTALRAREIEPTGFYPHGDPADEIRRLALEGEYDAIVTGSPPRALIRRVIGGSVALRLAANAPVTVIIARRD